jgi:hypothetical protein
MVRFKIGTAYQNRFLLDKAIKLRLLFAERVGSPALIEIRPEETT